MCSYEIADSYCKIIANVNDCHCRWSSYQEGWRGPKLSHDLAIDEKKSLFFSTALASSMAPSVAMKLPIVIVKSLQK